MKTQPITTPKIRQLLTTYGNDNETHIPAGWVVRLVNELQKDKTATICGHDRAEREAIAATSATWGHLYKYAQEWVACMADNLTEIHQPDFIPTDKEIKHAAKIITDYFWREYRIPQPQVG